jgi:acyl-CoA thioesterase
MLLLGAAIQPVVPGTKVGYMASLDHSMWFHNSHTVVLSTPSMSGIQTHNYSGDRH